MGRWRTKLLMTLIVYAAGFATAVYVLAPAPGQAQTSAAQTTDGWSHNAQAMIDTFNEQSPAWAMAMRTGMEKVKLFAEENALKVAQAVRQHAEQGTSDTGQ